MFEARMAAFRQRLNAAGVDAALITDDDSVYYLTGHYDYLHMTFGRPTILVVPKAGESVLITPTMEIHMAEAAAKVDRISVWNDGMGAEWRAELPALMRGVVGVEPDGMPPVVRRFVDAQGVVVRDVSPVLGGMRMMKTAEELQMARHAGMVGGAMMQAARDTIGDGVPEYEVALATAAAGTRKAAALLESHYSDGAMSPNTHFLQIMASGDEIAKPHHRASTRIMRRGEPVFMCFCGMTNFHRFKLGFDRMFWIGEVRDPAQAAGYAIALRAQAAALAVFGPGAVAEDVHAAYAEVVAGAGFEFPFRCGRATGFSFLEKPELVGGDKTVLQPGMVFAVDGSVTMNATFRAQVGDSFIVTEDGWEQITHHPKAIEDMVV
jgi:Xaa-Pro dipeptidase